MAIAKLDGSLQKTRITKLYSFEGLKRVDETIGYPGDVQVILGPVRQTIIENHHAMPFGALAALAGVLVFQLSEVATVKLAISLPSCNERISGCTPQIAHQNHFIDAAAIMHSP